MKGFAEAHRHKHGFNGFVYDTLKEQDERIKALEEASNSSDTPAEETPSDNNSSDTPTEEETQGQE